MYLGEHVDGIQRGVTHGPADYHSKLPGMELSVCYGRFLPSVCWMDHVFPPRGEVYPSTPDEVSCPVKQEVETPITVTEGCARHHVLYLYYCSYDMASSRLFVIGNNPGIRHAALGVLVDHRLQTVRRPIAGRGDAGQRK